MYVFGYGFGYPDHAQDTQKGITRMYKKVKMVLIAATALGVLQWIPNGAVPHIGL
jgi:hypothetical protein